MFSGGRHYPRGRGLLFAASAFFARPPSKPPTVMQELIALSIVLLVGVAGYLWNCHAAGKWLTWKEWGEFNGD